MIDHVWTVVCSRAVVDQKSNNVSLQNVLEQITISAVPSAGWALPISLDIMTLWARSDFIQPAQGQYRIAFRSPSAAIISGPFCRKVDLSEYKRMRDRVTVNSLRVDESGRHTFTVEFQLDGETNWTQVAVIPLEVLFKPPDVEGPEQLAEQVMDELKTWPDQPI